MVKKALLVAAVVFIVAAAGLLLWARAAFTGDTARNALAAQLAEALGQPVTIGTLGATIYPRLTVALGDVAIGQPARIQVRTLNVGTDFRALLSRRIEHGTMRLTGARVELPLPPLRPLEPTPGGAPTPAGPGATDAPPVEIVSIDEVLLEELEIVSGGRTLRGSVDVVPQGNALEIRSVTLTAEGMSLNASGRITDLTGPAGEMAIKAGALNVDQLLAFANDFAGGFTATGSADPAGPSPRLNIALALAADRASIGTLTLDTLTGQARLTPAGLTLDPVGFGIFGGRYQGALALTQEGTTPAFRLKAALSGVDMAALTRYAGSPDTITGRLAGRLELVGRAADAAMALRTARGIARVDLTDGTIKNLGLVRSVVVATSMRSDAPQAGAGGGAEPFSRLGATLAIAEGGATTNDLRFESRDLLLGAAGTVRLDGSDINLRGRVQLSNELTQQAGRDLVRYTAEQGRVTLPVTIAGSAEQPRVRVDAADVAKRAIRNRVSEEADKALKRGLGGLFGR